MPVVLVVQEDDMVGDLFDLALSVEGFEVHRATRAEAALREMRAAAAPMIVLADASLLDSTRADMLREAHEEGPALSRHCYVATNDWDDRETGASLAFHAAIARTGGGTFSWPADICALVAYVRLCAEVLASGAAAIPRADGDGVTRRPSGTASLPRSLSNDIRDGNGVACA